MITQESSGQLGGRRLLAGDKFLMLEKLPLVHERAAPLAAARMIWYMVLMDSSCLKNP